jgi:hypothetical protein
MSFGPGSIAEVRAGMSVLDRNGENVGTVETVKLGDPQAVTDKGQMAYGNLLHDLKSAFGGGEPPVPDELAARLLRIGFVKVDGKGFLDRDLYVAADQVDGVTAGVVHLTATRDELMRESW